jgi:hypothetical protein
MAKKKKKSCIKFMEKNNKVIQIKTVLRFENFHRSIFIYIPILAEYLKDKAFNDRLLNA